ncbi:MAG TPA: aldo/keto reductase [Firmicutes bacterium]|jgi:hypothetical protein|nr:aldo/keto reductase [Bacillota bacterium]HCX77976.1 aldo/keto reductase [Bacillota bacterium]
MQYRKFGKHDLKVSALGFGCMRFPTLGEPGKIDEAEAIRMLRYAIDNGVNYIDTAWPYHNETSETLVGKALGQGYREKVYLATKSPVFLIKDPAEYDQYLNRQLEKLQTDHIDFYLLHALDEKKWQQCLEHNIFDFISRAKADGKIKHMGFSFHDDLSVFKEIVDAYDWDFCQIQYNYMNEEYQAGREGLRYAAAKGLGVVIMEPLLGGRLARVGSPALQAIWNKVPGKGTPVKWALRWLWNQPEVSVVLSGMSAMEQVEENVRIASEARINSLTKAELDVIRQAKEFYLAQTKVDCTGCQYCAGCPAKIKIDHIFQLYNSAYMYDEHQRARQAYKRMVEKEEDFSRCLDCGQCEEICPQHLEVRRHLRDFHKEFNENK